MPPDIRRLLADLVGFTRLGWARRWSGFGDWFGPPVKLASRLTGLAKPGAVLVDEALRDRAPVSFRYSQAGRRKLKGIRRPVAL